MLCNLLSLHNRRPYLYQSKGADNIYGAFVPRPSLPLSGETAQRHDTVPFRRSSGVKRRDFGVALINTTAPLASTPPFLLYTRNTWTLTIIWAVINSHQRLPSAPGAGDLHPCCRTEISGWVLERKQTATFHVLSRGALNASRSWRKIHWRCTFRPRIVYDRFLTKKDIRQFFNRKLLSLYMSPKYLLEIQLHHNLTMRDCLNGFMFPRSKQEDISLVKWILLAKIVVATWCTCRCNYSESSWKKSDKDGWTAVSRYSMSLGDKQPRFSSRTRLMWPTNLNPCHL